jgi:hypothetical protein
MSILSRLFKRKPTTEASIMNTGLDFAMAFGENWLSPIQIRLAAKYPMLTTEQLDGYNSACQTAMDDGHQFIMGTLSEVCRRQQMIPGTVLAEQLRSYMRPKYPWINQSNLSHLYSQGRYYAWKEGLDRALA